MQYLYPLAVFIRFLLATKVLEVDDLVIPGGLSLRIKWDHVLAYEKYRKGRGSKTVPANTYKMIKFLGVMSTFWGTVTKTAYANLYTLKTRYDVCIRISLVLSRLLHPSPPTLLPSTLLQIRDNLGRSRG
jgi:hypothetical protein